MPEEQKITTRWTRTPFWFGYEVGLGLIMSGLSVYFGLIVFRWIAGHVLAWMY